MTDPHKEGNDDLQGSLLEAYEAGFAAGVNAEHSRILAVRAVSLEGHEALTEKMMLDGHTTEGEAAMAVVAAEREAMEKAAQVDAKTRAAMLRIEWRSDASLRNRFRQDFRRYRAYALNKALVIVRD